MSEHVSLMPLQKSDTQIIVETAYCQLSGTAAKALILIGILLVSGAAAYVRVCRRRRRSIRNRRGVNGISINQLTALKTYLESKIGETD